MRTQSSMPMPPGISSSPLSRTPSAKPAGVTERIASITRRRKRIRFSKEPPKRRCAGWSAAT